MTETNQSEKERYQKDGIFLERRKRRTFSDDFKKHIVELYRAGKPRASLIKDYDLTESALDRWIQNYNRSGSFKAKDNRTAEENELIRLQKENQQLKMENDILKQAALIFGKDQRQR